MNNPLKTPELNLAKATNYKLEISNLPGVNFWVTQCNLPSVNINEVSIPHPLHGFVWIPSDTMDWDPITLTFIVDEKFENYKQVFDWMSDMATADAEKRKSLGEIMVTASIHLLTNNKNPSGVSFVFNNIFPTTLGEIDFNNESTEPLSCSLTMNYSYMDMVSK